MLEYRQLTDPEAEVKHRLTILFLFLMSCTAVLALVEGVLVNQEEQLGANCIGTLFMYSTDSSGQWAANSHSNDVTNNVISTSLSYNINQWINPTHEFEDGGLTGGFDCGGGVEQQLLPGSFSRTYRRISYKPDTTLPVNYIAYQKVGDINGHCTANAPYTIQ